MEIQKSSNYPRMYVDPVTARRRQNWHFMNKYLPLSQALGKSVFIDTAYSIAEFSLLNTALFVIHKADAVRIYIAAYPQDVTSLGLDSKYADTLTIIYAPCKSDNSTGTEIFKDVSGIFYIIHPTKGLLSIKLDLAKSLIDNYRNSAIKLPLLTRIIHANGGNNNYTDTHSVLHLKIDFEELMDESVYQGAVKIGLQFTSYSNTETNSRDNKYLCRLTIAYELIDAAGKVIDITEQGREHQVKYDEKGKILDDFNNADLCPPFKCDGASI